MHLVFCKSKWEKWDDPLPDFLARTSADGFDATELYLKTVSEPADEVAALHEEHGLQLLGQILTEGSTPADHLRSLEEQFDFAVSCGSFAVNHHAGRDIFPFEDNVRIFERIIELGLEHDVPVMVETHRGRPTYSAVETRRYLEALPALRLTADFSHWMVVHESDLRDQDETVALASGRSLHIHARVGYEEGPQVSDPRAAEWQGHVQRHLDIWRGVVDARRRAGADVLTITPEFGPPAYMHTIPHTNEPVADTWEVNVYMLGLLRRELSP